MGAGRQIGSGNSRGRGDAAIARAAARVAAGALAAVVYFGPAETVAGAEEAAHRPSAKPSGQSAIQSPTPPAGGKPSSKSAAPTPAPTPEDFGPGSGWIDPAAARPGPCEFLFKSGERTEGEVLKLEGERIRIRTFGGEPFSMARGAMKLVRPLDPAAALTRQAKAMADKGDVDGAIALMRSNLAAHPELEGDFVQYASRKKAKARAERGQALSAYERELNDLLDRKNLLGAKARVVRELAEDPDDPNLLEDAIMVEFLIHRGRGLAPSTFASAYSDRLRELDPDSEILRGVDAEMNVAASMNAKWENKRDAILSTALDRAGKLFEAFRNEEARDVLDEALKLRPSVEDEQRMRELLAKIDGELATERADERARNDAKLESARQKSRVAGSDGQNLSGDQLEKLRNRMKRRKERR